jgi:hypothetical protein
MTTEDERRRTNAEYASIELHIDELVLEGFAPGERYRIGDAVQQELTRLLTTQGLNMTHSAEIEQLRVNAAGVNPRVASATNGEHIARAVYEGLNAQK